MAIFKNEKTGNYLVKIYGYDANGKKTKQILRSAKTRKKAEELQRKLQNEIDGITEKSDNRNIPLSVVIKDYKATLNSKKTKEWYLDMLLPLDTFNQKKLKDKPVKTLVLKDLEDYKAYLQTENINRKKDDDTPKYRTEVSLKGYIAVLNLLLNYAFKHGYISKPLCINNPEPKEIDHDFLEKDEIQKLYEHINSSDKPEYLLYFVTLGLYQGLRKDEIMKLQKKHLDFKSKTLKIIGKGGRFDIVPMHPKTAEILSKFSGKYMQIPATAYIISKHSAYNKKMVDIDKALATAISACVVDKNITAHSLRRTYITQLALAGINFKTIQFLARHRTEKMTLKYMKFSPAHHSEIASKMLNYDTSEDTAK